MLDSSTIRWIAAFLIVGLPGSPATAEPFHSQSQNGTSAMETPAEFWLRNAWLVDPGDTTDPYLAHVRIADGRIAEILDARAAAADTQAELLAESLPKRFQSMPLPYWGHPPSTLPEAVSTSKVGAGTVCSARYHRGGKEIRTCCFAWMWGIRKTKPLPPVWFFRTGRTRKPCARSHG